MLSMIALAFLSALASLRLIAPLYHQNISLCLASMQGGFALFPLRIAFDSGCGLHSCCTVCSCAMRHFYQFFMEIFHTANLCTRA